SAVNVFWPRADRMTGHCGGKVKNGKNKPAMHYCGTIVGVTGTSFSLPDNSCLKEVCRPSLWEMFFVVYCPCTALVLLRGTVACCERFVARSHGRRPGKAGAELIRHAGCQ